MPSTLNPAYSLCGLRFGNKPLLELHIREDHPHRVFLAKGDGDPGNTRTPAPLARSTGEKPANCRYTGRSMLKEDHAMSAVAVSAPPAESAGPRWRALLEDRWRARVQEITALSLAYHQAAAPADDRDGDSGSRQAERLLRRTVAARRKLADIEEALARLASGNYGRCEQCRSPLSRELLTVIPETRYCPACAESA